MLPSPLLPRPRLRLVAIALAAILALPLAAQAEMEVTGPVPAGIQAFLYGMSLDIFSAGATSVSAEHSSKQR